MGKRLAFIIATTCVLLITGCGDSDSVEDPAGADSQMVENTDQTDTEEKYIDVLSPLDGVTMEVTDCSDTSVSVRITNDTDKDIVNAEELENTFGILISLPENPNWITDSEYYLVDENNLRISYHDSIADADCTLLVSKNNNLNLPQNEYDEILNESWEGKTISGQNIVVKVQHGKNDGNMVLASWEYNEYQFAIIGEDENDAKSIPTVALYIIRQLN